MYSYNIKRLIIRQFKKEKEELKDMESVFEFESELERSIDELIDSATHKISTFKNS